MSNLRKIDLYGHEGTGDMQMGIHDSDDDLSCNECGKDLSPDNPLWETNTRDTYICNTDSCTIAHRDSQFELLYHQESKYVAVCVDCGTDHESEDDILDAKECDRDNDDWFCNDCVNDMEVE